MSKPVNLGLEAVDPFVVRGLGRLLDRVVRTDSPAPHTARELC